MVVGILMVVVLAVFAQAMMRATERRTAQAGASAARLALLDQALANFVAQHRRLPCPARGSIASGAASAGVETLNPGNGACNPADQADGVVPWVSLGLADSDALDPWHGRISYRVQAALTNSLTSAMNMSWCAAGGTPSTGAGAALTCAANCTGNACTAPNDYLYGRGLALKDGAGAWLNQPSPAWPGAPAPRPASNGAAYVLVVHGPNGAGAYNAAGLFQTGAASGTMEAQNANRQALVASSVFIDAARNISAGTSYFDDELSHPTVSAVLARAGLGPRPH